MNTDEKSNCETKSTNDSLLSVEINKNSFFKSLFSKRRNITKLVWIIVVILSITSIFAFSAISSCVVITALICIGILTNLFLTYVHIDYFSIDAYITVPILYALAFIKFILIPTDISINNDKRSNDFEQLFNNLNTTWTVVYWLSIFFGTVVLKFQTFYWRQGYPTVVRKIKGALMGLLKQILIIIVITVVLVGYLTFKLGVSEMKSVLFGAIRVMNLLYTLIFFIFLLGFGIVELPLYYLTYTSTEAKVKVSLQKLQGLQLDTQNSMNIFHLDREILIDCCNIIFKIPGHPSFSFAQNIMKDINDLKLEHNELFNKDKSSVKALVKKPEKELINDDSLAVIYTQVMEDYFLATKNFALFMKVFISITSELEPCIPEELKETNDNGETVISHLGIDTADIVNKDPSLVFIKRGRFNANETTLFIVPKKYNIKAEIISKTFGVIVSLLSAAVVVMQFTLFDAHGFNLFGKLLELTYNKYYLCYICIMLYIGYMFCCSYFALTQFKIADCYLIVKHHTNKMGLAFNARLCDTLIFGIIYNIVAFLGPVFFDNSEKKGTSTIENFYKTMKDTGIMFTGYYYYFPSLLTIIIITYISKKFNLFCFKDKGGDLYFEQFDASNISEDNLQKAYTIIQKIEKLYSPAQLEKAFEDRRKTKSSKRKETDNVSTISNMSSKNNTSTNMSSNPLNENGFDKEAKTQSLIGVKEIAYMQGFMLLTIEKNKLKSEKKYCKVTKTKFIYADNREEKNKSEILLREISTITFENKVNLKINSESLKTDIILSSSTLRDSEKLMEITQWKDTLEMYKKMAN